MSDNTDKQHTYIVETIFNRLKEEENGSRNLIIDSHRLSFTNPNKSAAKQSAMEWFDKVRRNGLEVSFGYVLKSIVLPSALLQIGLIDKELYDQEEEARDSSHEDSL